MKVLNDLHPEFCMVAVVGLPHTEGVYCEGENLICRKHTARCSSGMGTVELENRGCRDICVDIFGDIEAAAEGALLGQWQYNSTSHRVEKATVHMFREKPDSSDMRCGVKTTGLVF